MTTNIETAFASHVVDLVKSAEGQPGQAERYMPWYGAAGLGAIGHTLGPRALPKKFKLLGEVAGTLGGTYAGVHGGEVVGRAMDKRAEELGPEKPDYNKTLRRIALRQAGTTMKEIGAVTLPVAAGMGAGYGIQKYLEHTGRPVAPVARKILAFSSLPAVGLAVGTAYRAAQGLKEHEFGRIRTEEQGKYDQAMREWEQGLKRTPVPESVP